MVYLKIFGLMCLMLMLCGLVIIPVSAEEYNILSEEQTTLWERQTSPVYKVTLNCEGTVRMTTSYGSQFYLYARKNTGYDSCPSETSMRHNYDKVAYGYGGTTTMTLEKGVWCLMVYGYSGTGTYSLRVSSYCPQPTTPYPTSQPTPYPTPCGVHKTDNRQGFLNQGQAVVYAYSIPSDGRSKIDWTMSSTGSCPGETTPVIIASAGESIDSAASCTGSSTFDLYVFKDCNPNNSRCNTQYHSYGPNSYVSVANPSSGSTYYVMINARSGSGTYNLKMNSYKCSGGGGNTPIIAASMDEGFLTGVGQTGIEDTASGTEVSSPDAQFISSGSAS